MDYKKLFETDIRSDLIKLWQAQGKKALGIVCCHVPFELLHAAGVCPVRLRATGCVDKGGSDAYFMPESCGFTKTIFQNLTDGTYDLDGLVTSDGCDVASQIAAHWETYLKKQSMERFVFRISAPRMVNTASYNFFKYELEDLRDALEALTGNKITDEKLKNSMDTYNEARQLVRQVYDLHMAENPVISGTDTLKIVLAATELPIEEYIELVKAFLEDAKNMEPITGFGARVMLVGSALDDPEFIKLVEASGCLVAADLNSFGTRFLRDPLEYDEENLMGSLAKHYLCRSSCPRMMDGSDGIHEYILRSAGEFRVDGVIIERMKYCDKWQNESYMLGETLKKEGIPFLELERQENLSAEAQITLRAEAFREMLENK